MKLNTFISVAVDYNQELQENCFGSAGGDVDGEKPVTVDILFQTELVAND